MREKDYIKATNLANARAMEAISRDILPGSDYGIDRYEYQNLRTSLNNMVSHLFSSIDIEESE